MENQEITDIIQENLLTTNQDAKGIFDIKEFIKSDFIYKDKPLHSQKRFKIYSDTLHSGDALLSYLTVQNIFNESTL
jgi:hypothetical protein